MSTMPNKCPSAASNNLVEIKVEKFQLETAEKLLHTIIIY